MEGGECYKEVKRNNSYCPHITFLVTSFNLIEATHEIKTFTVSSGGGS